MKKIILASASPGRKLLLEQIGLKFKIVPSDFKEDYSQKLKPKALAKKLSFGKAKTVAEKHKGAIIIGADLFVVFKDKLMGKPKDKKDAYRMLNELNGKCHSVITGITVMDSGTGKYLSKAVETKLYLKKLTPAEIKAYVATGEPIGKGGGYAIQGLGAVLIKKVVGDYTNIIGLPISELTEMLKEFGVKVLKESVSTRPTI